jgi:drug/metabolite transporter (DMT)-like permease
MTAPSGAGSSRTIGLICLLVTSLGWGSNWSVMKFLLAEWTPLFARGVAGVIASIIMFAIAIVRAEPIAIPRGAAPRLVLAAFFNVFAWMGFATLALRWLSAGQGAMLVYTMPVWVAFLAWPIRGTRPDLVTLASLVLCFTGIGVLFGEQGAATSLASWPGIVFALLSASLFALGTVAVRPVALPPFAQLGWQLALGCMPMVAWGLAFEHPRWDALSTKGVAAMAYMTIVPMGVCYLAWFAALRRLPPATASMGTLLTPVVGVMGGALMLGEPLGARELAALALVIAGVALALQRKPA